MTDLGAEPALDAEHGVGVQDVDQFVEWLTERCGGQIPPDVANLFNLGKKKTPDLGAEPAVDEQVVLSGEALHLLNSFAADRSNPGTPGSLPKEKKDTKTSAKKRKMGDSPQVSALVEKKSKYKLKKKYYTSKVQENDKEIKIVRCSERVNNKLAKMEKDETILMKHVKTLEKHKTQIDESQEKQLKTLKSELAKIKNNTDKINEEGAKKKDYYIRKIKKWQSKQERARTEMEKSVEEAKEDKNKAKEKAKQNIEAAKEWEEDEKEKINREIQNIKDEEDKEKTTIKNNIEAKKNTLANEKDQFDKNIKRMNEEQAKKIAGIEAEIQKLNDDESKMKEAKDCEINAKRETFDELKRKIQEEEHDFNRKINKIEADIKYLKEIKARKENEIQKNFELLRNNKQKLAESIQAIQQEELNLKYLQNQLAVTTQETNKNLAVKEQQTAATAKDINMRIHNMKEIEKKIEKNIQESKDTIARMHQHVARREIVLANKIKAIQKGEHEETKEYDAIIKNMDELQKQIKKYNVEKIADGLHKIKILDKWGYQDIFRSLHPNAAKIALPTFSDHRPTVTTLQRRGN